MVPRPLFLYGYKFSIKFLGIISKYVCVLVQFRIRMQLPMVWFCCNFYDSFLVFFNYWTCSRYSNLTTLVLQYCIYILRIALPSCSCRNPNTKESYNECPSGGRAPMDGAARRINLTTLQDGTVPLCTLHQCLQVCFGILSSTENADWSLWVAPEWIACGVKDFFSTLLVFPICSSLDARTFLLLLSTEFQRPTTKSKIIRVWSRDSK